MLKNIYNRLCSLNLGLWLMSGVMLALAVGSFSRGSSETAGLNDMPLVLWLQLAPLSFSWWLWLSVALVALPALVAAQSAKPASQAQKAAAGFGVTHTTFQIEDAAQADCPDC